MGYISNTDADRAEMLAAIGVSSFQDLMAPIPEPIQLKGLLNVPPALDEASLVRHLGGIAAKNADPVELRNEASDLIYHLYVLLINQGVSPDAIWQTLAERHSSKNASGVNPT